MFTISNSATLDDYIKQLVQIDTTSSKSKIFFITNLEVCITCNQPRLNSIFSKLKKSLDNCNVNFVVESKNKKDSYYLKSKFKSAKFYEDNNVFLTSKLNCPLVIVLSKNNINTYYKINDLRDILKEDFIYYLISNKNLFNREFVISEDSNQYLSKVKVINDKSNLRIFDYQNKIFLTYNKQGQIIDKMTFDDTLMIYKGSLENKDSCGKDGFSYDFDIKKVNYLNDTLYILFDRLLYDIKRSPENKYGISLRSAIGKYSSKKLIDHKILDIRAYKNYFIKNNKNIMEYFIHPRIYKDTNIFLSEIDYYNTKDTNLWNMSLSKLNNNFDLKV